MKINVLGIKTMQNKNQDKSQKSASTPNGTIAASIVNFLNSLSQNFQLSQREAQVHQQCLENTKTSKLLREKQEFINEVNHQMPILLTSKSRLVVLESILVARARDGYFQFAVRNSQFAIADVIDN
jgi:beta-phosphoglucomutase-like phosphatase (HAD superfamily)